MRRFSFTFGGTIARNQGFTLVELITVIVILGILALGTTRYIINSAQQYTESAARTKLAASGRVAVEKVARRLRNALPNSIRLSAVGAGGAQCVEYLPVVAATSTPAVVPVTVSVLDVAPFNLGGTAPYYAVIAPLTPAELYNPSDPSNAVIVAANLSAGAAINQIPLAAANRFPRTSPTERVYLVQNPERFCVEAGNPVRLMFYQGYSINSSSPNPLSPPLDGSASLISQNLDVAASGFDFQAASLVRNAMVEISFNFLQGEERIGLQHEVQIRNVP